MLSPCGERVGGAPSPRGGDRPYGAYPGGGGGVVRTNELDVHVEHVPGRGYSRSRIASVIPRSPSSSTSPFPVTTSPLTAVGTRSAADNKSCHLRPRPLRRPRACVTRGFMMESSISPDGTPAWPQTSRESVPRTAAIPFEAGAGLEEARDAQWRAGRRIGIAVRHLLRQRSRR